MTDAQTAPERERVQALAAEYRAQGYDVAVDPAPHELPDFLSGYRPDLIVSRGGEATVVEVKSRRSLSAEAQTRQIARLMEGRPGWRFELVLIPTEPVDPLVGSVGFDRAGVRRALEEARRLLTDGYTGPSLLSGWAALEAALRMLLTEEGVELRRLDPSHLLKQAVAEGVISRDDYRASSGLTSERNALAHGFENEAVSPARVADLLELTERLLNEASLNQSA